MEAPTHPLEAVVYRYVRAHGSIDMLALAEALSGREQPPPAYLEVAADVLGGRERNA
jgi:hypothetical protein